MPILRALSIKLVVMPEPGKATRPFGRKFSRTSLRRKGAASFACRAAGEGPGGMRAEFAAMAHAPGTMEPAVPSFGPGAGILKFGRFRPRVRTMLKDRDIVTRVKPVRRAAWRDRVKADLAAQVEAGGTLYGYRKDGAYIARTRDGDLIITPGVRESA